MWGNINHAEAIALTSLNFAYKEIIASHHLRVPPRPFIPDTKKSLNPNKKNLLDDNLVIHGDNLEALKALLPKYGGRVKCIYIDPPYNTGNEGWKYNDNVNSSFFKRWLKQTVDADDLERHDKWCCMMWPRLRMLRELLADNGAIFISIDDNEQHRLRMMMDEIFGAKNFIGNIIWQKKFSPQNDAKHLSDNHDFIIVYAKDSVIWRPNLLPRTEKQNKAYSNPDKDPRGRWMSSGLDVKTYQKEYDYTIITPSGRAVTPPRDQCWRYSKEKFEELVTDNRIWFGKNNNNVPRLKRFLSEVKQGITPLTVWLHKDVGHTQSATQMLKKIGISFPNPKPHTLIKQVLCIGADQDSVVLDSFAGSGTTAHAVLELNKQDGGNRRVILVECEDYADTITAERVRRVIKGIPNAKNEILKEGTGGSFTYCTLGKPMDIEKMLTGESLPDTTTLASYLLYQVTGISTEMTLKPNRDGLFHSTDNIDYYLIYRPELKYLRKKKASLTAKRAKAISKKKKPAVVFAADKEQSQRDLSKLHIEFCRLPDAIFRNQFA